MNSSTIGLAIGAVLGLVGAFGGFGAFLLVAVCAAIGFGVGRYLDGELDLSGVVGRDTARRR